MFLIKYLLVFSTRLTAAAAMKTKWVDRIKSHRNLDSSSATNSRQVYGLEEMVDLDSQKLSSSSNYIKGVRYSNEKSDSYVVDLGCFSPGLDRDSSPNSRIVLQRIFSRKEEKKPSPRATSMDKDTGSAKCIVGGNPAAVTMGGTAERPASPQVHHHITVTGAALGSPSAGESARALMRCGSRRSRPRWALDPTLVLILFATMSSMGTLLLIYFTLTMGKLKEDGDPVR